MKQVKPDIIPLTWFDRDSTDVALDLLGCQLVRCLSDGEEIRGTIVETEAYGPTDPACHAYRRRTPRNAVMFGPAGQAYVYQIYGMYYCFNIVTDREEVASAVLIRALAFHKWPPTVVPDPKVKLHRLAAGPGKLCRVMQIDRSLNAKPLEAGGSLWVEHRNPEFAHKFTEGAVAVKQTTRIGLNQGADLPWRWYLSDSPAVSKR